MKTVKLTTAILLEGNNEVQQADSVHDVSDAQAEGLIAQGYAVEFTAEEAPAKGKGK